MEISLTMPQLVGLGIFLCTTTAGIIIGTVGTKQKDFGIILFVGAIGFIFAMGGWEITKDITDDNRITKAREEYKQARRDFTDNQKQYEGSDMDQEWKSLVKILKLEPSRGLKEQAILHCVELKPRLSKLEPSQYREIVHLACISLDCDWVRGHLRKFVKVEPLFKVEKE